MANKVKAWLCLLAILSLSVGQTLAQQTSTKTSIAQLKQEIQKLKALTNDAETTAEVREINRRFIQERQVRLQSLLEQRIDSLQKYVASAGDTLSNDEKRVVLNSIQDLTRDLRDLQAELQGLSAQNSDLGKSALIASISPTGFLVGSTNKSDEQPISVASIKQSSALTANETSTLLSGATKTAPAPAPQLTTGKNCAELNARRAKDPNSISEIDNFICAQVSRINTRKGSDPAAGLVITEDFFRLVVFLIAKKETPAFLVEAEESRVDKQVGSSPGTTAGSTSLVTKGGVPSVLGLAVENGALERTVDGTTVTFRGNPVGIVQALRGKGFIESFAVAEDDPFIKLLRKVSFGASFDTSRGTDPGVFTANRQQLSAVNVRVEFLNNRNPNVSKKEWDKFLVERAQPFFNQVNASTKKLIDVSELPREVWLDPAMQAWYEETQTALSTAVGDQVEAVFKRQYNKLPVDELSASTVFQLNEFARMFKVFLEGRDEVLDEIAKGGIVTFEYTNKREVNAPNTSNFTVIAETGTKGKVDLTFNGALTIFDKKPVGDNVGRIRDFQFGGQLDSPFGDVRGIGQFVFSFSGRYERLMQDAQTQVGTTLPNTKGDIAVGQFKLTVPVKGLGMKFPISVTFANRTELVKEKEVRGNFGFTFDLDTLFARFKPF